VEKRQYPRERFGEAWDVESALHRTRASEDEVDGRVAREPGGDGDVPRKVHEAVLHMEAGVVEAASGAGGA
jgi:hypothetical protein